MLEPSIDALLQVNDSKYKLVVVSAKRAKALDQGDQCLVDKPKSNKNVGKALEEILKNKVLII